MMKQTDDVDVVDMPTRWPSRSPLIAALVITAPDWLTEAWSPLLNMARHT